LSANHRATPFTSLERLSDVGDQLRSGIPDAHETISGAVVLATCNRFEAYLDVAPDEDHTPQAAVDAALAEIAKLSGLPYRELHDELDFTVGNRVATHLFAVASGLDSVAVGEDEIAGQVRRAYDEARAQGRTTRPLEHLFERASETSREVKNATRLGESGRSLVRLALELASSRVPDWTGARVLLVGTGRYAAASLAALRARGASDIVVHSVSGRGESFAARHGLALVGVGDYAAELARADVIVTCTTRVAVEAAALESARRNGHGSVLVIDLGMPRNVEEAVGRLPGVELLDLDTIRLHAPIDEFASLRDAHAIVDAAAGRHASARRVHEVAPAVVEVRSWVQGLLDAELARSAGGADTERALRHFAGVVMHQLIARGHTLAARGEGERWSTAVRDVLDLPSVDDATGR
jgi:glutamyl-tRNA reductase